MLKTHSFFTMPQVKACSFTLFLLLKTVVVLAQTPLNGQIFTNGLSIINAPALNSYVFLVVGKPQI